MEWYGYMTSKDIIKNTTMSVKSTYDVMLSLEKHEKLKQAFLLNNVELFVI